MKKWDFEQKHMDTRVTITLYSSRKEEDIIPDVQKAFAMFQKLEDLFSIFRQDSELAHLNQQAGKPVSATLLLFETLEYAMKIAKESNGVFSPFQSSQGGFPSHTDIHLDSFTHTIIIPPQTCLDLNSIVKGLAIDMALECFGDNEDIMIEAGGDIKVRGLPPQADTWNIGIRNPAFPEKIITVVHVRDGAICTSGEYFRKDHLVNLLAKKSKSDGDRIRSVTVVSPTAREADGLSTAAYFMGIDEAISFVEEHDSASCLVIDSTNNIYAGPRMKTLFKT